MAQYTLEKFECEGDVGSVSIRWERWKRSLYIYIEAAGIDTELKKRASLLHFGGCELQEIFYSIPGANINDGDLFNIAIQKLDEYFAPKQSKVYERHLFRLLKQETDEKFEKFLVRLRHQASKCQFADQEDHIIDQIVEKGRSDDLRKKILKAGDKITLDEIVIEANVLEAIDRQLENFGQKVPDNSSINRISIDHGKSKAAKLIYEQCSRCGSKKHFSRDKICPARGKTCLKCGIVGHFRLQCRTRDHKKRKLDEERIDKNGNKRVKSSYTTETANNITSNENKIDYIFNVEDDIKITCNIGGTRVNMLIDSGCRHNLITRQTWEVMKQNKAQVTNINRNPIKTFIAYGSAVPLELLGSFQANIQFKGVSENTTFYVVASGSRNLLGRLTAMSLGVLQINVNQIETKIFPKFKDVLVVIPIDDSVKPIVQPYRRIPIPLEEKVQSKLNELLQKDIIEEVNGPSCWVSPIVPVVKENGDIRICIDMRRANTAIKRENHPLPTMDQLLPRVKDATIFSKLDIQDAFYHVELHPDSRHITTFITSKGLFRYKRMMFGITCAPEIFQKTLERILLGCEGVINFIDDILIFGDDLEQHDHRLKKVMEVLNEHHVVLRKEKCTFRVNVIHFLGHELSEIGVKPLDRYISTIKDFRAPETISELQSFMGLVNFVGKWVPHLATITEPLKEILRQKLVRNADIRKYWRESQQKCFNDLKSALINVPTLGYYDPSDKTLVIADASPVGLGAVLVQIKKDGPRIIAFGNKTLSSCERRYCQTEKEALALVWAVEHFDMFLYGKKFELITDHKPLEVIFSPKSKPCARIERWVLRLQSYDFEVKYRPGKTNIADPLSRLCKLAINPKAIYDDYVSSITEMARPVAIPLQEISECSRQDSEIQKVKEGLYKNIWDESINTYKIFQNELCFQGDMLLRGTKIVIPTNLRSRVLGSAHEGHPGIVAMKNRLRTKVWWPKCDKDAENCCKSCKGCTLVSAPNPPNPLKRRELPTEPWIDTAIDLMGPLPRGEYLLVLVDYYSRYKEVKICRVITSAEIINHLKDIFSRLGNPVSITADNGRQFTSEEFKTFCSERNITIFNTIPYWPQQNGEVERQNRDILKRLKISQVEHKDWKEALREYMTMYNSTPHSITGKTPAELFFRRHFRDKLPMIQDMTFAGDQEVRDRDRQQKEKGKEYADKKRKSSDSELEVGGISCSAAVTVACVSDPVAPAEDGALVF
ncbi:uncharacterized protein K02A2.6-like [Vanessa cardui]|uniref:uncharacterized protein K02A2.6-like n=1 Tax=Vanessa cardui TaxID=171605 RepID=UPI001F145BD2|nr:uncharacterized protein K02A2.6-like [Vanessa cardui]